MRNYLLVFAVMLALMGSVSATSLITPDAWVVSFGDQNIYRFNASHDGDFLGATTVSEKLLSITVDLKRNLVWAGGYESGNVTRINASNGQIIGNTHVSGSDGPNSMAVDKSGVVWVANDLNNTLVRINSTTGNVIGSNIMLPAPSCVAVDVDNQVWVGTNLISRVYYLNATTGNVGGYITVGATPYGIAIDTHKVIWVTNYLDDNVTRINATSHTIINTVRVGHLPHQIVVDSHDVVWVSNSGSGTVTRINASTATVIGNVTVGNTPIGIAVDSHGVVWVSNKDSSTVTRINSTTALVINSISTGALPFNEGDSTGFTLEYITLGGYGTTTTTTTTTTVTTTTIPVSWYNSTWIAKKAVTIHTVEAATNYPFLLKLNTTGMSSSCDEIRITNSSNVLQNIGLESGCGTATTYLWLQLTQGADITQNYSIYYKNSSNVGGVFNISGVFPDSLIRFYPTRDLLDYVGGYNLSLSAGSIVHDYGRRGWINESLYTDGNNHYSATDIGLPIGASSRTICFYENYTGTLDNEYRGIFVYGTNGGYQFWDVCKGGSGDNRMRIEVWGTGVGGTNPDGRWRFICTKYNGTEFSIYENGTLFDHSAASLNTASTGIMRIFENPALNNWIGTGEEFTVYNSSLSDIQIADLYMRAEPTQVYGSEEGIPTSTTTTTTTTTISSSTSSTSSTVSTTSTTTTIAPLNLYFDAPGWTDMSIEQNNSYGVRVRAVCGLTTCHNTKVYVRSDPGVIFGTDSVSCGNINIGKSCNGSFLMNATGAVGSTSNVFAYLNTTEGDVRRGGFNATIINQTVRSPRMRVVVSGDYNTYAIKGKIFPVTVNVTCLNGYCGWVELGLDPLAGVSASKFLPASYALDNDTLEGYCNSTMDRPYYDYQLFKNDVLNVSGTLFSAQSVDAGSYHSCGIRMNDSRLLCWGRNDHGQIGDNTTTQRNLPTRVLANYQFTEVALGTSSTCAIRYNDSKVMCWGYGYQGNTGQNVTTDNWVPKVIIGNDRFSHIASSGYGYCAIKKNDSRAMCWGYCTWGECGDGKWTGSGYGIMRPSSVYYKYEYSLITGGSTFMCALRKNDSTAWCWGYNSNGQLGDRSTSSRGRPVAVYGGIPFKFIQAISADVFGLRANDSVMMGWGNNLNGQLCNGSHSGSSGYPTKPFKVNADYKFSWVGGGDSSYSCHIRVNDSRVSCCGSGYGDSPVNINDKSTFAMINPGNVEHQCGIRLNDSKVVCWGGGGDGKLGLNNTNSQTLPVLPVVGKRANQLYHGGFRKLVDTAVVAVPKLNTALGDSFILSCRGRNYTSFNNWINSTPVIISATTTTTTTTSTTTTTLQTIAASTNVPQVNDTDMIWGFGNATYDEKLGYYYKWLRNDVLNSSGVVFNPRAVSVGYDFTCAIRANDSRVFCWGHNNYGQLGNGRTANSLTAVPINSTLKFAQIASGYTHTCAIRADNNRLYCWGGYGSPGEMGTGGYENNSNPVPVESNAQFKFVSAAQYYTCAIRLNDSQVMCWGSTGGYGRLGINGSANYYKPEVIWGKYKFSMISTGDIHACGIRYPDGRVMCWGTGTYGELGNNLTSQKNWPVLTIDASPYTYIGAGGYFTCGIRANDSRILCWGYGTNGQLGNGGTAQKNIPTRISDNLKYVSLAAGNSGVCAITSTGVVRCWGTNNAGQLGDNTTTQRNSPVQIADSRTYAMLSSQQNIVCGVRNIDKKMYCWGYNANGQLGDNTTTQRTTPKALARNYNFYPGFSSGDLDPSFVTGDKTTIGDNWTLSVLASTGASNTSWNNASVIVMATTTSTTTTTTLVTTTTLPPSILSFTINRTNPPQGASLLVSGIFNEGTNIGLEQYWVTLNDSLVGSVRNAVNGTGNSFVFSTTGYRGNYTLRMYLNDSKNVINYSTIALNVYVDPPHLINASMTPHSILQQSGKFFNFSAYFVQGSNPLTIWTAIFHGLDPESSSFNFNHNASAGANFMQVESTDVNYGNYSVNVTLSDSQSNVIVSSLGLVTMTTLPHCGTCYYFKNYTNLSYGRNMVSIAIPSQFYRVNMDCRSNIVCPGGTNRIRVNASYNLYNSDVYDDFIVGSNTYHNSGTFSKVYNVSSMPVELDSINPWGASCNQSYYVNISSIVCVTTTTLVPPKAYIKPDPQAYDSHQLVASCASQKDSTVGFISYKIYKNGAVDASGNVSSIVRASAGTNHTCAITGDNSHLICWGLNNYGQLGDTTVTNRLIPTSVFSNDTFRVVQSGTYHTCAIRLNDSEMFCWGRDSYGQLGINATVDTREPVEVMGGYSFTKVALGDAATCGLRGDGVVMCWGSNGMGQIGNGGGESMYLMPVPINITNTTFTDVVGGMSYFCALESYTGRAFCWGDNSNGQLGVNSTDMVFKNPVVVNTTSRFSSLSAGAFHMCGVRSSDERVMCWGANSYGELGFGNTTSRAYPVLINSSASYAMVSSGRVLTCGILTNGSVKCWGLSYSLTPIKLLGSSPSRYVTSGGYHVCALRNNDSTLMCQGSGVFGQLGNGGTSNSPAMGVVTTGFNLTNPVSYDTNVTVAVIPSGLTTIGDSWMTSCSYTDNSTSSTWANSSATGIVADGTPTTTTTTTLPPSTPQLTHANMNNTRFYNGSSVLFYGLAAQGTYPLSRFWFTYNGTVGGSFTAWAGNVSLIWNTAGVAPGNYSIIYYLNDSHNQVTSVPFGRIWIIPPYIPPTSSTSSTTTTSSSTTTTTLVSTCNGYCVTHGRIGGLCRENSTQCGVNGELYYAGGDAYCGVNPSCCCLLPTTTTIVTTTTTTLPWVPKSGLVPSYNGTPFYVNSTNPRSCGQMWGGSSCSKTFYVNATGQAGELHRFFAFANSSVGSYAQSRNFYVYIVGIPGVTTHSYGGDGFFCNVSASDPDGDNTSIINYKWYLNNTVVGTGSSYQCNYSICHYGSVVYCEACAVDEHGYDNMCNRSDGSLIINKPPEVIPYITPRQPMDFDNLLCNENATEFDGDTLVFNYSWFKNGLKINYTSKTLGAGATNETDVFACQVRTSDGTNIVKANSSNVTIGVLCPTEVQLLFPPNWSQVIGTPIDFDWSDASSKWNMTIKYNLQVSNETNFSVNLVDIDPIPSYYNSSESYKEGYYYWRVRVRGGNCLTNWSKPFIFKYVNGTCRDGVQNFHDGAMEEHVDCGGPCPACQCSSINSGIVEILAQNNATGAMESVTINTTSLADLENHCRDGCFGPEFGESDVDCGGWGVWACPACGIGQTCNSDYECQDHLYCARSPGVNISGLCASNTVLDTCHNGIYNPTIGEADVDCGGPCNRCGVGKMCNGTVDCQDNLVCNQFDRCQEPTVDMERKKGRQYGAIGAKGVGMNNMLCSTSSGNIYQAKSQDIGDTLSCRTLGSKSISGENQGTWQYAVDLSDFQKLTDQLDSNGMMLRMVVHIDVMTTGADGKARWLPFWMASDGQEYKCISNADCSAQGVYAISDQTSVAIGTGSPQSLETHAQGVCKWRDWTYRPSSSGFSFGSEYVTDLGQIANCRYKCAGADEYVGIFKGYISPVINKIWPGSRLTEDCPPECKNCAPFPGSVPFDGFDATESALRYGSVSNTLLGNPTIPQSKCMYIPLCEGLTYRVSAKIYGIDSNGQQQELVKAPYSTCSAQFIAPVHDLSVLQLPCNPMSDFPIKSTDSNGNAFTKSTCIRPLFWDVGRCDGEDMTAKLEVDKTDPKETFRRYYSTTGCEYTDDVKNWFYIRSSCLISPDDDQLFSNMIQRPLKEYGACASGSPSDVLIDFSDVYKDVLHNKDFMGGKYYREPNGPNMNRKILMLIFRATHEDPNNQRECLVYDNLNYNLFNSFSTTEGYFDLYRGGESIEGKLYGPRIRIPLCKDETYKVLLAYVDKPMSQVGDRSFTSIWDYQTIIAKQLKPSYLSGETLNYIPDSKIDGPLRNFLNRYMPGGFSLNCAPTSKVDDLCIKETYFDDLLKTRGVEKIFENTFVLREDAGYGITTKDPTTGDTLCYADYFMKFKYDAKALESGSLWNWYGMSEDQKDYATLGETDKWLDTFYAMFNPFNLSLPFNWSYDRIVTVFINEGLLNGIYRLMLIALYFISKLMIWVMIYGLIANLWLHSARRNSIYVLLLALFLLLLLLGKFGTYSEFMSMLKGG